MNTIKKNNKYYFIKQNNKYFAIKETPKPIPDYTKIPLTFEALENNSTITFANTGSGGGATYNLKYSTDNKNWLLFADSSTSTINTITLNNIGYKVYIKGTYSGQTSSKSNKFVMTGKINVSGNLYSILDENNFKNIEDLTNYGTYLFRNIFNQCDSLVDASNLKLPALILSSYCYYYMFADCTSLVSVPELPATTLATYCYYRMFTGCTSLTIAPELPATTLANNCYQYMFMGCTSLTNAPELPATTLTQNCYAYMFQQCTSLTNAPQLPATTLANYCYYSMFRASGIINAPELPATTLANNCYYSMFQGCTQLKTIKLSYIGNFSTTYFNNWVNSFTSSGITYVFPSTGIFYYNGTDTSNFGVSAIPSGWTVQPFS